MARPTALRRRVSEFVESCRRVYSEATVRTYRGVLATMVRDAEALGLPSNVSQWSEPDILALKECWEVRDAPKTLSLRFAVLNRFLTFHRNPTITEMRARNRLRLPKAERGLVRWHTPTDQARLFAEADGTDRMILVLGYWLGLRRGEMAGLRLGDISSSGARIMGKGQKARWMPIVPEVAREIERYRRGTRADVVSQAHKSGHRGPEPDHLLIWSRGATLVQYRPDGIWERLKRLGARAEVEEITTHDLRRTFGRSFYQEGVALPVIQKALGHSSVATTIDYLGIGQEDLRAAFQAITTGACTTLGIASVGNQ